MIALYMGNELRFLAVYTNYKCIKVITVLLYKYKDRIIHPLKFDRRVVFVSVKNSC